MKKKKVQAFQKKKKYWDWEGYRKFLYRDPPTKERWQEKVTDFLFKIGVVFVAAFFTTLTFNLLLRPNGIYNSGLNGFFQIMLNLFTGYSEIVRSYYSLILFGTAFLVNSAIIFVLCGWFGGKVRILSTAIFYSLAQIFWDWLFSFLQWNKFMFSSFSPENWSFGQKQLGFTLPFYVTIALLASLIHTYGYSLIFKSRSTPGGLEIITSHLSTQKSSKVTLSFLFKVFGFFIIFLITVINFFLIENNPKVKKAELKTYLLKKCKENEENFIHEEDDLEKILNEWKDKKLDKKDLEEKKTKLESVIDQEKSPEARQKNKEQIFQIQHEIFQIQHETAPLSTHLKSKINSEYLETYPAEELDQHLLDNESLKQNIESKIAVEKEKSILSQKESDYLEYLLNCLERVKKNTLEKTPKGYLKYITNDERLWATLVYILFSAFLISQMFPKDIKVNLTVQADSRKKWIQVLELLKEFKPNYYINHFHELKTGEEKTAYMADCLITKWGYYLIKQKLEAIGVIASIKGLG